MKLYLNPISTYSQKTVFAFYCKGVPFESEVVRILQPDVNKKFSETVFPLAQLPTLETDDKKIITESSIIIEWLDMNYPGGVQFIPEDPAIRLKTRELDRLIDGFFNNPIIPMIFESQKPKAEQNTEVLNKNINRIHAAMKYFDNVIEKNGPWLVGDNITLSDCSFVGVMFYLSVFFPLFRYRSILKYQRNLFQSSAYRELGKFIEPAVKSMKFDLFS